MWCVLVFVGYGHTFVNNYGTKFYKVCYYDKKYAIAYVRSIEDAK